MIGEGCGTGGLRFSKPFEQLDSFLCAQIPSPEGAEEIARQGMIEDLQEVIGP